MSSVYYEEQILNAIETMVDNAVARADYDKTIKATILSCTDATIGKYKVKYQDSIFDAYCNNLNITYADGAQVNILVPRNNMKQNKIILNAIDKDGIETGGTIETEDYYELIGGNTLNNTEEYSLCSYNNEDIITLYDKENEINLINLDIVAFENNLAEADSIICGGLFRTNLDTDQQRQGNYGIAFDIVFTDNIDGGDVVKTYTIDVNNMKGNPYILTNATRQSNIFNIPVENYKEIKDIYIFAKNFPNTEESKEDDIFISNFELYASRALSEEELSDYSLKLNLDKSYFGIKDSGDAEIKVTGSIRLGNREIEAGNRNFEYYWFKQNANIDIKDKEYVSYGGAGWECLNNYNIIDADTDQRQYVSSNNTLTVTKDSCSAAHNIYKLVAIFTNGKVLSQTIDIKNYDSDYIFTIESDEGDTFYYDNGSPSLTVYVNGEENKDYTYKWASVDNNGLYTQLEETTNYNNEYNVAVASYNLLKTQIEKEDKMALASEEELQRYLTTIEKYDTIERVEGNKIHNINISNINDYTDYICSVYAENELIGSVSIRIKNITFIEGDYICNIINGTQTFNYSGAGVSPTNRGLEKSIDLDDLKIDIIDSQGNHLPDKILKSCDIVWTLPSGNTMISGEISTDKLSVDYSIADKYDITKLDNNNIQVDVTYKTLKMHAETAFTFVKDGEPGTNGTDIICKIVPNTTAELEYYPTIIDGELNYTPAAVDKWFKIQLWENGSLIWEGFDSDENVSVTFEVLKNNYGNNHTDNSSITINNNNFSYTGYKNEGANIIKATVVYKGLTYYSTMPIITVETLTGYSANLVKNSGFRYVMYDSDGRSPQYDNILPFEIKVNQLINGYNEDISTLTNNYKLTYNWITKGSKYNGDNKVDDIYLTINEPTTSNKANIIPKDEYNGEVVNNAVEVLIIQSGRQIAKIHIPIHFYLNRYGIAALNDWDGNKITLNDDEGAILAPQVGAGSKNSQNQFTGVLMGAVKESGSTSIEQGLFGYHNGQRTIFLDAETGTAKFGKNGKGQIILDPTSDTAEIKSGNYSTTNKTGMLIDLTTPKIEFGSGKFKVSSTGIVTATDVDLTGKITASSGKIGNWTIDNGAIKYNDNVYLGSNGSIKFGNFSVNTSGNMTATGATITGNITATTLTATQSGKIASFNFDGNAMYNTGIGNPGSTGISGNIADWEIWAGNGAFRVTQGGQLNCSNINVTGGSITGGTINIGANGGYLRVGYGYTHPEVSGLNMSGSGNGIKMNGTGISGIGSINVVSGNAGTTLRDAMYIRRVKKNVGTDEGYYTMTIEQGIITNVTTHTS